MLAEVRERCDVIEECYEFMLAYAAQGLPSDKSSRSGGQIREFMRRAVKALAGLAETCLMAVKYEGLEPAERYEAFFAVLDRDARDSLAAMELVLAQPAISSQLIDNLNASIHLRAMLTDLFLVGEILSAHCVQGTAQAKSVGSLSSGEPPR
ncbi:MAG TPA: hypothetical protein VK335_13980 [Bryobacteraceae bacterium]|nr:hypothetical protein [Bryobacteraceae bacterium]HXR15488.1 hypothetical protein [Terriglobales bacterium]